MITVDKYTRFVINNHADIKALFDIVEHVKRQLPPLVNQEVASAILELEASYFLEEGFHTGETPKLEVWWGHPDTYDAENYRGAYFGFEYSVTWENIWNGSADKPAYFYLYVSTENVGKRSIKEFVDQWTKVLTANRHKLGNSGILPWFETGFSYEDPYLVGYPLHREINLETLADPQRFRQQIQAAVKVFTSTLLPILRQAPVSNRLETYDD